jgi:peptidoglycan/LPS O-acetylase OafA/YrhL
LEENKLPRLEIIEVLRGLAAFMVAGFHIASTGYLPKENIMAQGFSFGWAGVNIFFIISGFILPLSMFAANYSISNYFQFLKKRIIRIEPPYIISFLVIILLVAFTRYYSPGSVTFSSIIGHIAYINAFTGDPWLNIVYWTLAIEFQFYLTIGLLFTLLLNKKMATQLLIFILFLAINIIPVNECLSLLPGHFNFFMFGMLLFQYNIKLLDTNCFLCYFVILFLFTAWHNSISLACLALFTVLVIQFFKQKTFKSKSLMFLGSISYSLYLIHSPAGNILVALVKKVNTNPHFITFSIFIILIVTVAISYFFYLIAEKPFKKMSASFKYTGSGSKHVLNG